MVTAPRPRTRGGRGTLIIDGVAGSRRIRTPMWVRAAGYWGYQYKRTWRSSIVTSFLIPVLYLAAMGVALGSLIDKHSHGVDGVSYVAFLAPGLLAGTAMQIGTNDATYPVMGGIKWMRTYFAQLASPLSVYDVLLGHLAWIAARLAIVVTIYLGVMAAFGVVYSPWAVSGSARRRADRDGVRRPDQRLRRDAGDRRPLHDAVPLRHHPHVLVLGDLLPHIPAPDLAPGGGLPDAPLPRGRTVPRPHAGPGVGGPTSATRRIWPCGRAAAMPSDAAPSPLGWWCDGRDPNPLGPATPRASRPGSPPRRSSGDATPAGCSSATSSSTAGPGSFSSRGSSSRSSTCSPSVIGLSHLVGPISVDGQLVPYTAFVAPGLLASSAMNGAMIDSTFLVFFKLKIAKTYDAMLATPLGVGDVALGELGWCVLRGALYSAAFLAIMAILGYVVSPWAVLCWPAAILIWLAFASAGMAGTTYMRTWQDFDMVSLAFIPLFLFSATFYPLTVYPGWLQAVVRCTPLYQGVVLVRAADLGIFGWFLVPHVIYLVVMAIGGMAVTRRRLGRLLLP